MKFDWAVIRLIAAKLRCYKIAGGIKLVSPN